MHLHDLMPVGACEWEIPVTYRADMRVPVRLFASRELLEQVIADASLEQAVNAATLPGLVGPVVVMPDVHQGYGFPIGGVAATEYPSGVVSPGAIGYDINCGVRLLASGVPFEAAKSEMRALADQLYRRCPSGVGGEGLLRVSAAELDAVLRDGAGWTLRHGYASESDLARTEEGGCLAEADPAQVSVRAKERGREQLGSLGSGNHFLEVDVIEEVYDESAAEVLGLAPGNLAVQIHCGSRGLGHQVCTDYVQQFQSVVKRYGIALPDRELVCAPMDRPEGQAYLSAMRAAANYAFANRQLLAWAARQVFDEVFGRRFGRRTHLTQVYDVGHNMGKIETHTIDGRRMRVCVHRKGATRAFGPGAPELPAEYRRLGQPVIIPGSMGTASWVLVGTVESMRKSFGSTCHGAGRVWSRAKAKRELRGEELRRALEARGIAVRAGSLPGLAEEAPQAYKDVDAVVRTVEAAGIARKVARLRPVAIVKG